MKILEFHFETTPQKSWNFNPKKYPWKSWNFTPKYPGKSWKRTYGFRYEPWMNINLRGHTNMITALGLGKNNALTLRVRELFLPSPRAIIMFVWPLRVIVLFCMAPYPLGNIPIISLTKWRPMGVFSTPSDAILWPIYTDLHGSATRGADLESGQFLAPTHP